MGTVKKQKRARKEALKNRYCAGAKLSEHKFLRILRGFAEGMTLSALEPMTHTSGKTIRATYRVLRERLTEAVTHQPESFGQAGLFLHSDESGALLEAIRRSPHCRRHRMRHAPRLKSIEEERLYTIELAVRIFCALDMRGIVQGGARTGETLKELAIALPHLKASDSFGRLAEWIPGAKPHAHPEMRLYEYYRRYLLTNPLGI